MKPYKQRMAKAHLPTPDPVDEGAAWACPSCGEVAPDVDYVFREGDAVPVLVERGACGLVVSLR